MLPYQYLLCTTLLTSTGLIISSCSVIATWIALEINTIALIPLISASASSNYFIVQSFGSALFLLGLASSTQTLIIIGLAINIGLAPFHTWVPNTMNSIEWIPCLALITIQNVGPICIIISIDPYLWYILISAISCILGSLGAINSTQLREILGYSSVVHMGWVVAAMTLDIFTSLSYFIIYSAISITLVTILSISNINNPIGGNIVIMMVFGALSGVPPFFSFAPNIIILFYSPLILKPLLVLSALFITYVYMQAIFSITLNPNLNTNGSFITFFILVTPCLVHWIW